MTPDVHVAARELLGEIRAPRGAVNTMVGRTPSGLVIRVLVDPSLRGSLPDVPSSFHGHPVVVEVRVPSIAGRSFH